MYINVDFEGRHIKTYIIHSFFENADKNKIKMFDIYLLLSQKSPSKPAAHSHSLVLHAPPFWQGGVQIA